MNNNGAERKTTKSGRRRGPQGGQGGTRALSAHDVAPRIADRRERPRLPPLGTWSVRILCKASAYSRRTRQGHRTCWHRVHDAHLDCASVDRGRCQRKKRCRPSAFVGSLHYHDRTTAGTAWARSQKSRCERSSPCDVDGIRKGSCSP